MTDTVRDPARPAGRSLGRNRDFLRLWLAAGCTILGGHITDVVYPLVVLWQTGSAGQAGLVGFAALLPQLLVQLPAGALVDRWDRRKVMISADVGCLLATGGVAVLVATGRIWIPVLMAAAFLQGSCVVFYQLAERAAVPRLVAPEQLGSAMSRNEARSRVAALLGQPVGSALFAVLRWVPFVATAVLHLVSLAAVLLIRKPMQGDRPPPRHLRTEIAEGIAWMWRQRFLRTVIGLIAATNVVFRGLTMALMVIVHSGGGSAAIVGVVSVAGGIGGTLGALSGTWWMKRVSLGAVAIGGLIVWSVLVPVPAFVQDPIVIAVLFAANGYVGGVFNVVGGVYMVGTTPDALQGRVNSVAGLVLVGAVSAGSLLSGYLLDAAGVVRTVLALGALMVLLAMLAVLSPVVRARTGREGRLSPP
ncbi:MFS transporter [Amycolatopsis samaneae]|uniref:MFS transporter n=1 Tax=Amycolatopsis samaneae TaxID=664691 RepID=A0ABW5GPD6_9PSEU